MIPNIYPGCFIALEGIDGCGKSTQLKKVVDWVRANRRSVISTKEPGRDRFFGAKIHEDLKNPEGLNKKDPFRFQMLYARDSKEHLRKEIIPRLYAGCDIVSDRFRPSMVYGARPPYPNWFGMVYNKITSNEVLRKLMEMNQQVIGEDFIWPDAILIFDVSVKTAIERLQNQGKVLDFFEKEQVLEPARTKYIVFSSMFPNCYIIDGKKSPDEVFERVKSILEPILKLKLKN